MIQSLARANAILEVAPGAFLRKNQKVQIKLMHREVTC
jgi:hypothetical protein